MTISNIQKRRLQLCGLDHDCLETAYRYDDLAPPPPPPATDSEAKVRRSFITTTVREQRHRSHHKDRFELPTNGIQFYAIANLDKYYLSQDIDHKKKTVMSN